MLPAGAPPAGSNVLLGKRLWRAEQCKKKVLAWAAGWALRRTWVAQRCQRGEKQSGQWPRWLQQVERLRRAESGRGGCDERRAESG